MNSSRVLDSGTVSTTVLVLLASSIIYFGICLHHARMLLIDRKRQGLPVAPNHSYLFGHLLYLKSQLDALPKGAHFHYALAQIARQHFQSEGLFYIDLWPFGGLFITIISRHSATEVMQSTRGLATERPDMLQRFFRPITGGSSLFDMHESEWKPWRTMFNKCFQHDYVSSLVPGMIKETNTYTQTLEKLARTGDMCYLDTLTLRFMMDMIGKTVLNASFGAQTGYNVLADSMLSQIQWHQANAENNPLGYFNPARWYMHWWNGRKMDAYIGTELDKRYREMLADPGNIRHKAVIDLVLQASPGLSSSKFDTLDATFRSFAIRQIRLFLFVGHDSSSSAICYSFYLLSKSRRAYELLCREHDEVFGPDPLATPSQLEKNPHMINALPYTLAVIKETLRMFPPAAGIRQGKRGVSISDDKGNICPTDETMLLTVHVELHRSKQNWVRPDEFLPERWLVEPGHQLYPLKGAWRPFEHGPRNCVAQSLVLTELRIVLACVVRRFNIQPAYEEWDALHPRKGLKEFRGERVYQIEEGAAHPVEKYPCRVSFRSR